MPTSLAPYSILPVGAGPDYLAPSAAPQRVMFLSPRAFDLATLSASTAVSSLPVSNLQNPEPTKVWRTTSAAEQFVDIVLPSALACNAAAMSGFTPSQTLLWRLKAYATAEDVGGDHVLDTGWRSVWPQNFKHPDPDWGPEVAVLPVYNVSAWRYWRLEFNDLGLDYIDIGRLALGRAVQFSINVDIDAGIGFVANDVQEPNGYGQIFTDPRPYAQRQFEMKWSALAQQEVGTMAMELGRLRGQAGDVFCFLDPGEIDNFHRWSMHGLFSSRHQFTAGPVWVTDLDGLMRQAWGFLFSLVQKL